MGLVPEKANMLLSVSGYILSNSTHWTNQSSSSPLPILFVFFPATFLHVNNVYYSLKTLGPRYLFSKEFPDLAGLTIMPKWKDFSDMQKTHKTPTFECKLLETRNISVHCSMLSTQKTTQHIIKSRLIRVCKSLNKWRHLRAGQKEKHKFRPWRNTWIRVRTRLSDSKASLPLLYPTASWEVKRGLKAQAKGKVKCSIYSWSR